MRNLLKSIYISVYVTLLAVACVHSLIGLLEGVAIAWLGILIAVVPSFGLFLRLTMSPVARTSERLVFMPISAVVGSLLAFALAADATQVIYTAGYGLGVGVCGSLIYIYWYSVFDRTLSAALVNGCEIPEFELKNAQGNVWSSSELSNHPAVLLFFRGNWCPLCMAQIKEIADKYNIMESMGVKVFLISPQPEKKTRSLAEKFNVNYHFMVDENNRAAKRLGIDAKHGAPIGVGALGYDSDTVLPTVILTDPEGKIIFTDQTDNYRVRPEPDTFIAMFKAAGIA